MNNKKLDPFLLEALEYLRDNYAVIKFQITPKDREFVRDMINRFKRYREHTIVSPKQEAWIFTIRDTTKVGG